MADQQAGVLPNEARDFFAARLTEAQAALRELTSYAYELNQHWHKMIADPGEAHLTSLAFSTTREPITTSAVQPTDRLRLARRAPMTMACGTDSDGAPCVTLYYANREVSAAAEWTLFLQTLTQQTEFTAQTATTWSHTEEAYPWPMVQEYLQAVAGTRIH